ncbi:hypothetical protein GQ54DRAFT_321051 [Martensiomyces pterosporus]|nr:hypothetical protein GQ54DRAFT_321051 [Martensiomyces pterosporus]
MKSFSELSLPSSTSDEKDSLSLAHPSSSLFSLGEASKAVCTSVPGGPLHSNADTEKKGSSLSAFLNILCLAIGVGSLQLSYTLKQSGWIGLLFIVLSAGVAFLTSMITVRCIYLKPGGGRISGFHDIGLAAFGRAGYYTITVFNMLNIIGSVGVYAILASNNISDLLAQVHIHVNPRILMLATTAIMCAPTLIARTLGETLIVSIIGTATSAIVTVVSIVMACVYPIRNGSMHVEGSAARPSPVVYHAAIPGGFAISLSTVSFAYIGSTIVPHLEHGMKRPEKFGMVFGLALAVIAGIYVSMAATGYWAYGSHTLSPILLNFPKSKYPQNWPAVSWPTTMANLCITIHVLFAGPLYLVQMALEVEGGLNIAKRGKKPEAIWRVCIRVGSALVVVGIAEALPFFDDVISLISALTNPVLIYLAPIACYVKLKGWRKCSKLSLAGLFLLLVFGVVVSAFGLVETVNDIILDFKHAK